jgi:hypothetical protein
MEETFGADDVFDLTDDLPALRAKLDAYGLGGRLGGISETV